MVVNRGKQFEAAIKEAIEKCPNISIDRFQDPAAGYAGIRNICDFVTYSYPFQYYFECKSFYGNTLNFQSSISKDQWDGLKAKSVIPGVFAGVIAWFIDHDVTVYIPIESLVELKNSGRKSLNIKDITSNSIPFITVPGKKKRVLFEYDGKTFYRELYRFAVEKENTNG